MLEIECSEKTKGVRHISMSGQHVLYKVNEAAPVLVLAVVGQRQYPSPIR